MNNDLEGGIQVEQIAITPDEVILMNQSYARANGIKCISFFDFILAIFTLFSMIYMESAIWFVGLASVLIIMGYIGAKTYNNCLLNGYILYLVIEIAEYVYFMYQYSFIGIIMILLNVYIIQYIYKLKSNIRRLSQNSLQMLIDGYNPITPVSFVYY